MSGHSIRFEEEIQIVDFQKTHEIQFGEEMWILEFHNGAKLGLVKT